MLKMKTLSVGALGTCCYIVWDDASETCVVIDPGYSPKQILDTAATLGKTVEAIFLTHGHFDHVGAVEAIVEATDCALWMREGDWSQFPSPFVMQLFPLANCDFCDVKHLAAEPANTLVSRHVQSAAVLFGVGTDKVVNRRVHQPFPLESCLAT